MWLDVQYLTYNPLKYREGGPRVSRLAFASADATVGI
jgi:hypothetical protein